MIINIYYHCNFLEGECIFIHKGFKRLIPLALVPVLLINTYAGCKFLSKKNNQKEESKTTHIIQLEERGSYNSLLEESNVREYSTGNEETSSNENVETTSIDNSNELTVLEKLHQLYTTSGQPLEQILSATDKSSEIYISALYEKTRINDISEEDLRKELDNILLFSLLYTDMSDEEWQLYFGHLQSTISYEENALEYYYPLAAYLHTLECDLIHEPDDIDESRIKCNDLVTRSSELISTRSYASYVIEMLSASNETELLNQFNNLCNVSENPDAVLNELYMLYLYSQTPMCLSDEEYYGTFKILSSTVSEYENIFEVYKKLSIFIHLLDCDFEHTVDECDVHVCKGLIKEY